MPNSAPLITHLLDCSFSTLPKCGYDGAPHLHHFHQLDVILGGTVNIGLGQKESVAAKRGHALLLPPLCQHSYAAKTEFRQATFKFHLAPAHWARFGNSPLHSQLPSNLLQNLEDAGKSHLACSPLCEVQAVAAATLCLTALLQTRPETEEFSFQESVLHPHLWTILEEVENSPFADWSVALLAQRCHLSPDHFSRCFLQFLQHTPQRYLLESRMKAAAAILLREPLRAIKQIAEDCGYASVHAFSRAFKSVFDCGPAAYRHTPRDF